MENYASLSLETHLFFARIMKEHSLFLMAGFPCKEKEWIQKADWYRQQFEHLLAEVVQIAQGRVDGCVLQSDELTTIFTVPAERKTEQLSGIPINSRITVMEQNLRRGCEPCQRESRESLTRIHRMNRRALRLVNGLIGFKENILREVGRCHLFTANYPLLIEHITREAKLYRDTIAALLQNRDICYKDLVGTENFWNQIMMEHALFIRGLLDPTEEQLIETADGFAADYRELLDMAKKQDCRASEELSKQSLEETLKYREFKTAGTEGILGCRIASLILPLLADHVLREANHYIRILDCGTEE